MTELETLKKEVAELRQRLDRVVRELCPTADDIQNEVDYLIQTLGPDKAAEEINRRNRLRRPL